MSDIGNGSRTRSLVWIVGLTVSAIVAYGVRDVLDSLKTVVALEQRINNLEANAERNAAQVDRNAAAIGELRSMCGARRR